MTVTSFYCQSAIEQFAAKTSIRLSPLTMMYINKTQDDEHLLRSARYLHQDLPIRFAHRIDDFRHLPFVVACNPLLLELHERFIKIFHTLNSFPPIQTLEHEKKFSELLQTILDHTSDTLPLLAEGFRESKRFIKQELLVKNFLDRALTSRLAIRMLIEHHRELREDRKNYIGAICMSFSPNDFIQSTANNLRKVFESIYGNAPDVTIDGHRHCTFPYLITAIQYIVPEILKNAFKATIEHHQKKLSKEMPPVNVTISVNTNDLILRITDRGGGMPKSLLKKIFDYHFSFSTDRKMFSHDELNENQISGYGFGLPTSRAYCEYLNGSLNIETLLGIGTDVYIRLGLLTAENRILRL